MKCFHKIAFSILAVTSVIASASPSFAQRPTTPQLSNNSVTGTNASYVGAGLTVDLNNAEGQEGANVLGNVQGRYAFGRVPFSLRGAAIFNDEAAALMPIVSYDVPITDQANLYLGGGYAFHVGDEESAVFGNQNAPVINIGAEAEFRRNLIVYGDTKIGVDAYENDSNPAVSFQIGAGYRFPTRR